jgi:hypothetical protein
MTGPLRVFFVAVCASVLGAAALLAQTPKPSDNLMEFVIGNGPHAGTYKLQPSDVMCMHFRQQNRVAVVFKDFDASDLKKIGEAGINIVNPDDAGPKQGDVLVGFGARGDKSATRYSVSIPGDSAGPITLIRNGKAVDVAFQGRTKDGVSLRVTARCPELEEL